MSDCRLRELSAQWFADYVRLGYWCARRWVARLLDSRAVGFDAERLESLAQDAVCRGYDRFVKRCAREVCGASERRRWVATCVVRGARDAVRSRSRFGSISSHVAVRDDVLNRCRRVHAVIDADGQLRDPLDLAEAQPVSYGPRRWELELLVAAKLPKRLQPTALYALCALTQAQSATLQGCCPRTVRARLAEIRAILQPKPNAYAVVVDALRQCLRGSPLSSDSRD